MFLLQARLWPREWVEVYLDSFFSLSTRWVWVVKRHAPAALPPGKTRYPWYRRLGGPQGWSGQTEYAPPEFDPQTVQPVVSHYTD